MSFVLAPPRAVALLAALLPAMLSAVLLTAPAAEASVVTPPVPAGLPSGIEGMPAYVPAVSCEPAAKPGVLKLARLLVATYPATSYLTSRTCGTSLPTSEHYDGRAVDWMVSVRSTTQAAEASAVLGWLFATDKAGHNDANLRRLGVMYVIWDNRIWGAWSGQWSAYSSCASHPEPPGTRPATATTSTSRCPGRAPGASRRSGASAWRLPTTAPAASAT